MFFFLRYFVFNSEDGILLNVNSLRFLFFFRPLRSVRLLQSNQRFQAIEFVDLHVSEKL